MSVQTTLSSAGASQAEVSRSRAAAGLLAGVRLNVAVCALMLALAFAFMSGGLIPGRVAAPAQQLLVFPPWQANYPDLRTFLRGGDIMLDVLPWQQWVQDELRAGRFPLWASGPLGGYNLFASDQPATLFPLTLLWALLPTGAGFGIIMALKLWLAGMGMWFFLRALGLRPWPSLLSAMGFMFSAGMVTWLPWPHAGVYLLFPWLAWAVYAWSAHKSLGALAGIAAITGCMVLGGQPEFLFFELVCCGVWALWLLLTGARADRVRQVVGLAVSMGAGLAMGAIQFLPFIEALGASHIAAQRHVGGGLAVLHIDAGMMLDWILPRTWGQIADGVVAGTDNFTGANAYVGLVALLGVVLALVGAVRRQLSLRLTIPWAVLGVFGWLVAYDTTIGQAIRSLPILNTSANGRWVLVVAFCVLVLGAFGWDWLSRALEARISSTSWSSPGWRGITGVCLLVLGAGIVSAHLTRLIPYPDLGRTARVLVPPTSGYDLYWALFASGIALGVAGATLIWVSGWRAGRVMPAVLGALLVIDLWTLLITFNPVAPADDYYPTTSFINQLSAVPPTERLLVEGENLPTNTGLVYGFRDWLAQDPMMPQRAYTASTFLDPNYDNTVWTGYNMFMDEVRLDVAPALGIRYFVLPKDHNPNYPTSPDPGHPNFTRLAYKDGLGLWEAQGVPGFAYLSDNVWAVQDEGGAVHWMTRITWDKMRNYAAMVEAPASAIAGMDHTAYIPGSGQPGSVTVAEYRPGKIALDVDAARPSLLVVAESADPGWHATIDGQQAAILRANYLSQGLLMPQGKHRVELDYAPESFRYGALISLAGLACLLGLIGWALLARRRSSKPSSSSA